MTRLRRLLPLLVVALAIVPPAIAGTQASTAAPAGLHAFLLRADEPRSDTFTRTPGFAWNPVAGAIRYEFELSTSSSFRDSGVVYSDTSLTTPVAAPALTLPWITGDPHALYARVRAVLADTTTTWSASFGFDMEPPAPARPLPSYPGLLRWTPVDGALGYEVWFVDLPKIVLTRTNVLDEREFYTFHQAASWLSQVRWRIRAVRSVYNAAANSLPVVTRSAWSPVYSSVNPPFAVGPLKPTATVSDVVANGTRSAPAHRLTPAFVFGGNQVGAQPSELYRVHVFTDRGCVNRVYTSTIVGGPAYAPRISGPLSLPRTGAAVLAARTAYLSDGDEGSSFLADFGSVASNESLPDPKPTTSLPSGAPASTTPAPAPTTPTTPTTPAPVAAVGTPGAIELLKTAGTQGPPVGLWDTDWASGGGYYWTVVPVEAKVPGAASTSVSGGGTLIGDVLIPVASSLGFAVGDNVTVGNPGNLEAATITSVTPTSLGTGAALKNGHGAGEPVIRTGGNIQYRDLELGQDACGAGRVLRFGKESEPTLTAGGEAFASGLSPDGKLASADDDPTFYGPPIVSWTAALGAEVYAVQWSRTSRPFVPQADPATTALGMLTVNTNAVLPLEPGTWYYRVRGYDGSLPTGAQAMSWSDPQRLDVTRPTFAVVSGGASTGLKSIRVPAGGFSLRLPASWNSSSRTTSGSALAPIALKGATQRLTARDPRGAALSVHSASDRGVIARSSWARRAKATAGALSGRVGAVRCSAASLPAGAGLRCTTSVRGSHGAQPVVLYLIQHRGATYTLAFTSLASRKAASAPAFAAVARSFRFTS